VTFTPESVSARTASGSAPASVMSSLISPTSQIRANATLPSLELSATTTTRRAQPIMTAFVCASTSWWVVQPACASMPSTPMNATLRLRPVRLASAMGPDSS
jgi:hypothetical protein